MRKKTTIACGSEAVVLAVTPLMEEIFSRGTFMIDPRLEGRTVLITGANHGIGAATARAFARQVPSVHHLFPFSFDVL